MPIVIILTLVTGAGDAVAQSTTDATGHLQDNLLEIREAWLVQQQLVAANSRAPIVFPYDNVRGMLEQTDHPGYRYEDIVTAQHRLYDVRRYSRYAGVGLAVCLIGALIAFFAPTKHPHHLAAVVIVLFLLTGLSLFPIWTVFLPLPTRGYDYADDYLYTPGITSVTSPHAILAYERPDLRPDSGAVVILTAGGTIAALPRTRLLEVLETTHNLLESEARFHQPKHQAE